MNKKITLLFTAAGAALLLSGCGSKDIARDYSKYVTLGSYTGLTTDRQIITITEEDLEDAVAGELSMLAEYNEITDRASKEGDIVVIDFSGTIGGEEFEGGSMEDIEVELGSDSFIDGFEDKITGMKTGEEKTFDLTFPEPYDGVLDGQTASFTVKLNTIYEVTMPDYNDEYVAGISDYTTVAEYEAALKKSMEEEYAADATNMACEDLLTTVIDSSQFSGRPEELYESCKTAVEAENKAMLEDYGASDIAEIYGEDYNEEAYIQEIMNERMVVYTIASKEKLSVSDEEYKDYLEEEMQYTEYLSVEEYEKSLGDTDSIKYQLLREKVLSFLEEHNTFNDIPAELFYEDMDVEFSDEEDMDVEFLDEEDMDAEFLDEEDMDSVDEEETESEKEETPESETESDTVE